MNRLEMIRCCEREGIKKGLTRKKKNDLQIILQDLKREKEKVIEDLKQKTNDDKDPILLEPFDEWSLTELKSAVTFNGFSYKESTIKDYIFTNTNTKTIESVSYKDPVNCFLSIPNNILHDFKPTIIKKQNVLNRVKFTFHLTSIMSKNIMYYCMYVVVDRKDENVEICPSNLYVIQPNEEFFLGFIPIDIELNSTAFMKAIDTMSSTPALLSRISSLFTDFKMIEYFVDDNKKEKTLALHGLKSILSIEPSLLWNSSSKKQTYNKLLEEITQYE